MAAEREEYENPHNVESQSDTKAIEADLRNDAIGSTLYSKKWVFDTLLKMSRTKSMEEFKRAAANAEEEFLSDLDSLVGMSASEDVCAFLASPDSLCLPMLAAELLLPSPFGPVAPPTFNEDDNSEKRAEVAAFVSHCMRRQELALVILSNVALRHRVVEGQLAPQACAADYLIQLPFSTAGLTDQTGYLEALQSQSPHVQEYTSVLTAFVMYLNNFIVSLGELTSSGADTPSSGVSEREEIDENVSRLTTALLAMISKPEVMDTLALVLATCKNKVLLRKCSQVMASIFDFVEGMQNSDGFFLQTAASQNVCRGFAEAVGQACESRDYETALKFIQVLGDMYYTSEVTQEDLDFPDRDEVLDQLCDHCCTITRVCSQETNHKEVLQDCATISKLLQYLWVRLGCFHLSSFQKLGQILMTHSNTDKENKKNLRRDSSEDLECLDTLNFSNIVSDGVNKFVQHYSERLSLIQDDRDLKELLDFLKTWEAHV